MDLKIKDIAEFLNIKKDEVNFLIKEASLPCYKLDGEYRFNTLEIEKWIGQKKYLSKGLNAKIGMQVFSLYRAIYKGGVFQDVPGETKEDIISETVKRLKKNMNLDSDVLIDLLMDREKLMSTGIGDGIAVPHTRDFLIKESFDIVSVVYPKKPIEYDALDGKKVHTLFFLFACNDKRHLNLLAKIAHFIKKENSLEFLKKKPNKESVLNYIKKWEEGLNL